MNHPSLKLTIALLALAAAGAAAAQSALPPVQTAGGVEILSGGVGSDQAKAIEAEGRQWPLTLEFAVAGKLRADHAANVQVSVRTANGQILQTTSQGPFLLLRLPPGQYDVSAQLDGKTLNQRITVAQGKPSKASFTWPEGTNS